MVLERGLAISFMKHYVKIPLKITARMNYNKSKMLLFNNPFTFSFNRDKIYFHDHKFVKLVGQSNEEKSTRSEERKVKFIINVLMHFHYPHMLPASVSLTFSRDRVNAFSPHNSYPKINFYYTPRHLLQHT